MGGAVHVLYGMFHWRFMHVAVVAGQQRSFGYEHI
jgi:hypothetical protein